jgi:spore maturation protein CgeB
MRTALWHLRHGGVAQARTHLRRQRRSRHLPGDGELLDAGGHLMFEPWSVLDRAPRRPGLRVAVILDDFSLSAFSHEWDQVEVTPSTWRSQLEAQPVDLLFVESAWHGNHDAWQFHLTGPSAPTAAVVGLVNWCRAHGIPTVFWNKEDPAHYDDFLAAARLFDHVYTTDSTCIERYELDLGHERVDVLPFAAQQSIHNPVRPVRGHQSRDIAFAGTYFAHKYPERRQQLDLLLGAAVAVSPRMDTGLEIFSRYHGGDDRYQFPAPWDERVVGSLSYDRMLTAYRAYKVFLNVNSVATSPSMCARRIFEVTASGTPVVSTPSPAVSEFFDDTMVSQPSTREEAGFVLRALVRSPELRDRTVHLGQRRIWSDHTYTRRIDRVLTAVGRTDLLSARPTLSVIVSTNRPDRLDDVLCTVSSQVDSAFEVLILTHGFSPSTSELHARARSLGVDSLQLLTAAPDVPLGECLNRLVRAAAGDVVAKMDDDDLYGPHYLCDQLHAMDYSGADVVGKQAHYMHLKDLGATILRFPEREHQYTDFVAGPTIVARRELALAVPFLPTSRGEDTAFLRNAAAEGATLYAADRFNFVQMRSDSGIAHTWNVTSSELLANSRLEFFGRNTRHIFC